MEQSKWGNLNEAVHAFLGSLSSLYGQHHSITGKADEEKIAVGKEAELGRREMGSISTCPREYVQGVKTYTSILWDT